MDQTPQPTHQPPQYSNRDNGGIPPMPTTNMGFQPDPAGNSTERRTKRRMYTLVQVISVVFLLISCVFVILGIVNVGSQFGKDEEAVATITKFNDDFGAIIDNSTEGFTNLSSGCYIHYEFAVNEVTYQGSTHDTEHCGQNIGDVIMVVYSKNNPMSNTLKVEWSPYDMYFLVGGILLIASLVMIIISTVLKSRVPNPDKPQVY